MLVAELGVGTVEVRGAGATAGQHVAYVETVLTVAR